MANNTVDRNSMLQVGTLLRGIYRIDNYLSSGGFGNTYVATNIEFDEQVAIKEFFIKGMSHRDTDTSGVNVSNLENVDQFNKMRDIFKREAKRLRLLGRFNNPHIVRVHDLFEANNTAYYVMQYINGSSLSELLKNQSGPFDTGWLMDSVLPQVLDALGVMHRNQMWHLDIKPSNIMVDVNGNVMIIDFGSTKQIDPNTGDPTISSTLSFTTTYAPLELQEYDYKKIGPWTDLYSLGATLYNLSTGKKPPRTSAINNEGVGAFQFFPGTKEEFKKLVVWMMSIRTENRPQSVDEVLQRLQNNDLPELKPVPEKKPVEPVIPNLGNMVPKPPVAGAGPQGIPLPPVAGNAPEVPIPPVSSEETEIGTPAGTPAIPAAMVPGIPDVGNNDNGGQYGNDNMGGELPSIDDQPYFPDNGGNADSSARRHRLPSNAMKHGPQPNPQKKGGISKATMFGIIAFLLTLVLAGLAFYYFFLKDTKSGGDKPGGGNDTIPAPTAIHQVTDSVITSTANDTTITYTYTGPVSNGLPNGQGKGVYKEGTYEGPYVDGVRQGDNAKFVYSMKGCKGDVYEGHFEKDFFDGECTYTQNDGYYFKGIAKRGNWYNGEWYDKSGKSISRVVDGKEKSK